MTANNNFFHFYIACKGLKEEQNFILSVKESFKAMIFWNK